MHDGVLVMVQVFCFGFVHIYIQLSLLLSIQKHHAKGNQCGSANPKALDSRLSSLIMVYMHQYQ